MNSAHLEPLKQKLVTTAQELMSCAGTDEFSSFDLIADGHRLVIEIAVLPPVTRNCEGAQRAAPPRPENSAQEAGKSRPRVPAERP
jgi:hypothetical protein